MVTEVPAAERPGFRAWLAPLAALLVMAGLLITVLVVARVTQEESLPPQPGPWVLPDAVSPTVPFDVERADGPVLTLAEGQDAERRSLELTIPDSAPVEFLEPAEPADVKEGDWLTVIGVRNEVRNFAVRLIVFTPGGGTPDADGWLRSPVGFVGHEAARESREVPILAGPVTSVRDGEVIVDAGESVTVTLNPGGPLRTVRSGSADEIRDGDRIAMHVSASGDGDPTRGVLVLVGGAR